jgi:hypothetical protein
VDADGSVNENELVKLYLGIKREVADAYVWIDWAEDEIKQAISRHPAEADALFHSFPLLTPPTHEGMSMEFVYRGHCREILERVAAGADTRPGTAAEVCIVLKEVSMVGPLKSGATGLYFRMWTLAFPGKVPEIDESIAHYEALCGSAIDDAERFVRHKLSVKARQLGDIECSGRHNGETVQCKYVTSPDDD